MIFLPHLNACGCSGLSMMMSDGGCGVDFVLVQNFIAFLDVFPLFGPSILEPDLHLSFGQIQRLRELGFPSNSDVAAVVELFFQF